MFDAETYFGRVQRVLETDSKISKIEAWDLTVEGNLQVWAVIRWRAKIRFHSGHILEVFETYGRKTVGRIVRRINYHFMTAEKKRIFLIDNHRNEYPFERPYHAHLGQDREEVENGHGRLCGYDLEKVDFLEAFRLAHRGIEGKKLPWE